MCSDEDKLNWNMFMFDAESIDEKMEIVVYKNTDETEIVATQELDKTFVSKTYLSTLDGDYSPVYGSLAGMSPKVELYLNFPCLTIDSDIVHGETETLKYRLWCQNRPFSGISNGLNLKPLNYTQGYVTNLYTAISWTRLFYYPEGDPDVFRKVYKDFKNLNIKMMDWILKGELPEPGNNDFGLAGGPESNFLRVYDASWNQIASKEINFAIVQVDASTIIAYNLNRIEIPKDIIKLSIRETIEQGGNTLLADFGTQSTFFCTEGQGFSILGGAGAGGPYRRGAMHHYYTKNCSSEVDPNSIDTQFCGHQSFCQACSRCDGEFAGEAYVIRPGQLKLQRCQEEVSGNFTSRSYCL